MKKISNSPRGSFMKKKFELMFFGVFLLFSCVGFVNAVNYAYLAEVTGTSILPSTVYAGDYASLVVNIKNRATSIPIADLNASLEIGEEFEPVKLSDSITEIQPKASTALFFKFRAKESTLPGYYPAFLTLDYSRDGTRVRETQTLTISVSRTAKNIDVTIEPRTINPGKQTNLVFTLENLGETPISNISFAWSEKNSLILPLGSDNKRFFPLLEPHAKKQLSYIAASDPNITPGIYPLDITITFTDVNSIRTQLSRVGLIAGGKTEFELSAEKGTSGQTSISIANVGSNNASAVVVKIPAQPGFRVIGSDTAMLGNLNKGDFTIANFQLTTSASSNALRETKDSNNAGSKRMPRASKGFSKQDLNLDSKKIGLLAVQISYTDTTGERHISNARVHLSQEPQSTFSGLYLKEKKQGLNLFSIAPWLAVVVIALLGFRWFYKRRAGQ